ncbi:hypothetical protein ACI2IY_05780 [Lysobacter enzymogenes]|uniref:hypothetical protein n=1 Tax=Lysobacter enzymogenes TaxID=69 RepID=UPI003850204D
MRKTIAEFVEQIAATLDAAGNQQAPIKVVGTREYLRDKFPPTKRGGPLLCGEHELVLATRPGKPSPLQNLDLFPEQERPA